MRTPPSAVFTSAFHRYRRRTLGPHDAGRAVAEAVEAGESFERAELAPTPLAPRRQEYFDWGKAVIDQLRGVHPKLEEVFDAAYMLRPV